MTAPVAAAPPWMPRGPTWAHVIRRARRVQRLAYYAVAPSDALWIVVLLLGYFLIGLMIVNASKGP